jgi:hypothetical protein
MERKVAIPKAATSRKGLEQRVTPAAAFSGQEGKGGVGDDSS